MLKSIQVALVAFGIAAAAASDTLVTLPSRLVASFAKGFGLVTAKPPLEIRSFNVSVYWHKRSEHDPRVVWLREQLQSLCASALMLRAPSSRGVR